MDEKSHLCLHGIQATRPVDRIPYAHISSLPDASYPRALFVCVHQLLINPLLLQPAQYGDRTMGPYPEKAVYFTAIFTSHTCQYSININLILRLKQSSTFISPLSFEFLGLFVQCNFGVETARLARFFLGA